ncbi:RHS repeat-associated core domain-containing protein [Streptomyces sp. NPDC059900]|uniref:RHS repeat-associated core domain-containing protein n=1 Tax=Streptomyces sp. NPDC059900 TaxID=3155816 RepID=UPI003422B0CA
MSFTYYADGSRRTVTDATGTRTFNYYDDGALKDVTAKGQTSGFAYKYDDAGQLKERTYPDGRTTTFTYTSDGNRDSSTTDGAKTTYGYTAARQLSRITLPTANGHEEKRTYDRAGRLTDVASTKGTTTLSAWHAELDATGQPRRIDATRGNDAASTYYTGDATGRLLTECTAAAKAESCPAGSPTTSYTYDRVGNRQTRTDPAGATTTYHYDAADQLRQTTGGATTDYDYDRDGNQTKAGSTSYSYDAGNQLAEVTTASASYAYVYDADGLRSAAKKNGTTLRTNTWDINYGDGLPRQATEAGASGSLIADYQYNPEDQIQGETTAAGSFYHHHDILGSVTDVTDSAGAHQTKYAYSAYGEVTTTNIGSKPPVNRFTFAGEYKEPTTSAAGYYLRARSYLPETGRFTSRDPLTPEPETPHTQAYAYANNAPAYLTDPSGQCWWIPNSGNKSCWTTNIPGTDFIPLSPALNKIGNAWQDSCKAGSSYAEANGRSGWSGCVDEFTGVGPMRRGVNYYEQGDAVNGTLECLGGIGQMGLFLMPGPRLPVSSPGGLSAAIGSVRWGAGGGGVTAQGLSYKTPVTPHLKKLINPRRGDYNCRACAVAVDQTLAGNPASAMNIGKGPHDHILRFYPGKSFERRTLSSIVKEIAQGGSGARGIVIGSRGRRGHAWNVANVGNDVVFLDGQTGHAEDIDYWGRYHFMRTN